MSEYVPALLSVAFHGLTLAMVLYLISVGLSVTMGLMGFVNLAHGAFAMAGGYVASTLLSRFGIPFAFAILLAVLVVTAASLVLERLLYRRFYGGTELDQVLLTMGLIFMSVGAATYIWGPLPQPMQPPPMLQGGIEIMGRVLPVYRLFLILCGGVVVTLLWLVLERTRFGAQLRAAVDNLRMAENGRYRHIAAVRVRVCVGERIGRAGWCARLGGSGHYAGLCARTSRVLFDRCRGGWARQRSWAVLCRAAGRHRRYRPEILRAGVGGVLYLSSHHGHSVALSAGIDGHMTPDSAPDANANKMPRLQPSPPWTLFHAATGCRWSKTLPWIAAIAAYFVFPDYLALGSQILATIIFALSVDLLIGYAGIVTLGHAALFGTGAYTAGLLAANGWGDPVSGLAHRCGCVGANGLCFGGAHTANVGSDVVDADFGGGGAAVRNCQ